MPKFYPTFLDTFWLHLQVSLRHLIALLPPLHCHRLDLDLHVHQLNYSVVGLAPLHPDLGPLAAYLVVVVVEVAGLYVVEEGDSLPHHLVILAGLVRPDTFPVHASAFFG